MTILYKADPERGLIWQAIFAERAPDLPFRIWPDIGDPEAVRYLVAWQPPDDFLALLPNLQIVFSVGAGVDQFDLQSLPPHIPLVRMIEPSLVEGMVDYVVLSVLATHRHLINYIGDQRRKQWKPIRLVPASQVRNSFATSSRDATSSFVYCLSRRKRGASSTGIPLTRCPEAQR